MFGILYQVLKVEVYVTVCLYCVTDSACSLHIETILYELHMASREWLVFVTF